MTSMYCSKCITRPNQNLKIKVNTTNKPITKLTQYMKRKVN